MCCLLVFFVMIRRPPRSTRTDTLFPYTTLFRSMPVLTSMLIIACAPNWIASPAAARSEEHTSELQSLMRISYAVFCLTKKKERPLSITAAQYLSTIITSQTHRHYITIITIIDTDLIQTDS